MTAYICRQFIPTKTDYSFSRFIMFTVFGRPFVKRFALRYRTVICPVCLSLLSVTLVYCGQTVGWIKMKLCMQLGLGSGHILSDGDTAPLPPKGHSPPIIGPYLLWPNGCTDQDATWYEGEPRPRPHCVTWGPSLPPKRDTTPQFSVHVYCGQTVAHLSYTAEHLY